MLIRPTILLILFFFLFPRMSFGQDDSIFTDVISTNSFGYDVYYTDDSGVCSGSLPRSHFIPEALAQIMADALHNTGTNTNGNPNGYHNGFANYGFKDPDFTSNDELKIWDCAPRNLGIAQVNNSGAAYADVTTIAIDNVTANIVPGMEVRSTNIKDDDDEGIFITQVLPGGSATPTSITLDTAVSPVDDEVISFFDQTSCDSGNAPATHINMPNTVYCNSSESNIRNVIGHELFHHTQFEYITFDKWLDWGRTAIEGTARMMEDHVYNDLDNHGLYKGQVASYLKNTNRDFWDVSYSAALGWKYAAEQYGNLATEPGIGVDFIRQFWENAEDNNDSPNTPDTFDQTIKQFDTSSSLREWFHDFSIANIAKEFDVTGLIDASKYRYIDENDGVSDKYDNVSRNWTDVIPFSGGGDSTNGFDISRWGVKYYEANVNTNTCPRGSVIGFRGQSVNDDSNQKIYYGLLAIKGANYVYDLQRAATTDFHRAYIQPTDPNIDTYTKLLVSLAGGDVNTDFEYIFDCGAPKLQILRPNNQYVSYVGDKTDPDNFIVRLLVEGPTTLGDPTILGLQPKDFKVFVGNMVDPLNEATVLSGSNVMGEYWLVVKAPIKVNDGTYPITVKFGSTLSDTEESAVRYEELILDQMLVIDTSGSMADPSSSPKMVAAKNAASMFVDILNSDDRVGSVQFNGNNNENDNDASLISMLKDADDAHKLLVKNQIYYGLTDTPDPAQMTSIGDGLEEARQEINIRGSALGEDWIILLSDGMENENFYWTDIKNNIINAGIKVNTIALGPYSDQELLKDIAEETNGEYYYVDVGSFTSNIISSPLNTNNLNSSSSINTLSYNLADAYAAASEKIKRHERIWETQSDSSGGLPKADSIVVKEGGIGKSTLSISWDGTATNVEFVLTDHNGNIVTNSLSTPIYEYGKHIVYHLPSLTPGNWKLTLNNADGDIAYKAILAGENNQGAKLTVVFDQKSEQRSNGYNRGLPVKIIAKLIDDKGVITNGIVEATVEHPSGAIDIIPLYDDGGHGDGATNDGVYSNIYTRTTEGSETGLQDVEGKLPGNGSRGSYIVSLRSSGVDNYREEFSRIKKGAFQILSDRFNPEADTDEDGMPNRYENLHFCLNQLINDGASDPDDDLLSNFDEWSRGTNPCNSDTDDGGENDGSEVSRGSNPFNRSDDAIGKIVEAEIINWQLEHIPFPDSVSFAPNQHNIRFSKPEGADGIQLFASPTENGQFSRIAVYSNNDLAASNGILSVSGINGSYQYYKIAGFAGNLIDPANQTYQIMGVKSHAFGDEFKIDMIPPIGGIKINNNSDYTESSFIDLTLNASNDTNEMRLSENPGDINNAPWIPYSESYSMNSVVDQNILTPNIHEIAVYVQFKDSSNNISEVLHDYIEKLSPQELHTVTGSLSYVDEDVDGIICGDWAPYQYVFIRSINNNNVSPVFMNNDCTFEISNLVDGEYLFEFSGNGILTKELSQPIQILGDVNIGEIEVEAIPEESTPIINIVAGIILSVILLLTGSIYQYRKS